MATPEKQELPSTYFVQDRSNESELNRVEVQGRMITASMGGVLPEQSDPSIFERVLDVGCGAGDWLIEVARTYPTASLLIGVDVSRRMIEYARTQVQAQQVGDKVEFHMMDASRTLEFPAQFFDLVNERFATSYMRTWDWLNLLGEFQRVTKPGGVIRITEPDAFVESTSPALSLYYELFMKAMYQAGHLFTQERDGLKKRLPSLLHQSGVQNVQTREYTLEYRMGTPEWQNFYNDVAYGLRTLVPFLRKWTQVPDDYDTICQQALDEIKQPDFVATWRLLTAWGNVP
ncbi:MAG: methyltransferase domain-containing protein [Ktedonobacteraceae bacterium]|nr:methyltransferase domain-containing protein [Ktedonobacteraceae bacterium]